MSQVAGAVWGWISVAGLLCGFLGFVGGMLFTRRHMAPAFCPECLKRKQWQKDLADEIRGKTPEEKAESRRFYGLRRWWKQRKQKTPGDSPPDAT